MKSLLSYFIRRRLRQDVPTFRLPAKLPAYPNPRVEPDVEIIAPDLKPKQSASNWADYDSPSKNRAPHPLAAHRRNEELPMLVRRQCDPSVTRG